MQRGSFKYRSLKAVVAIVVWLLMAGILWLGVLPIRLAAKEWGVAGAWAVLPVIVLIAWWADKWLDAHNARRAERLGLDPQRPDIH
jgi:uncharacterized membrane protein